MSCTPWARNDRALGFAILTSRRGRRCPSTGPRVLVAVAFALHVVPAGTCYGGAPSRTPAHRARRPEVPAGGGPGAWRPVADGIARVLPASARSGSVRDTSTGTEGSTELVPALLACLCELQCGGPSISMPDSMAHGSHLALAR